tara:strand:+ start:338 stop:490 length:153 start_codon:yes stop_codon:yes gene_type:complete
MKQEWAWMADSNRMFKCVKPLKHNPQFEGKHHCKACAAEKVIFDLTGEEE